ncbi:MAG: hypothetical protein Q4D06_09560, partial [Coriobacteriia bacterium]|nr:hypothetical protein [Coriobacteriia bacterium]
LPTMTNRAISVAPRLAADGYAFSGRFTAAGTLISWTLPGKTLIIYTLFALIGMKPCASGAGTLPVSAYLPAPARKVTDICLVVSCGLV